MGICSSYLLKPSEPSEHPSGRTGRLYAGLLRVRQGVYANAHETCSSERTFGNGRRLAQDACAAMIYEDSIKQNPANGVKGAFLLVQLPFSRCCFHFSRNQPHLYNFGVGRK